MIGLVLVTHGRLACEFRAAVEHVVGVQEHLLAVSVNPGDDMEKRRRDIVAAISEVDRGAGVVLLTDMFGGTPSNLAISLLEKGKVEVITGLNMPMLIKLTGIRDVRPLGAAVTEAKEAAKKYIAVASEFLSETG